MLRLLLIWLSLPSPDAPPQRLATSAAPSSAAATDGTDAAGASAAATDAPTSPQRPTSAAAAANAALTAALTAADAALAAAASTGAAAASLDAALTTAAAAASPQGLIGSPATSRLALEQLSAVNERLIALRDYASAQRPALPALTSAEEYAALAPAARLQRAEEVRGRVRVRVRAYP